VAARGQDQTKVGEHSSVGASLPGTVDAVVVGAGIIGLACARELRRRRPDWEILVLEKETGTARHQTGRSSGVIHSGVYYAPGSLKAQLCADGREQLRRFCDESGVPYELCGKVIVATEEGELERLAELERRAAANGVAAERIGPGRLRELEPHCVGIAALHLPGTGLVEFGRVAEALAREFEASGGRIGLGVRVEGLEERSRSVVVRTSVGEVQAQHVIACAGVHADTLVGRDGEEVRIVPFRGDYFALRPEARRLCRNLIYPVPDPAFPFLGVHVNRRPDGGVWAGPNAVVALALEGYRRRDLSPREAWRTLTYPGFVRLVGRYWRLGIAELYRDLFRRAYARQVQRYLPELGAEDLESAPAGIRAQALERDGTLVDDFLFAESARVLHVRNAPSPGATSSFAIAEYVVTRALAVFEG
jgi:(S)-2-hydroxyglutarate dehydrogenase